MRPRFQADENLNAKIVAGLLRREPSLDFQTAMAARLIGLSDPEVLAIAARDNRILVSHDRKTLPNHFRRFVETSTSAGVLIVSQKLEIGASIEQIFLVWIASEA
jgi:predicted nuclease of predicted toxin-antitoxin system